MADGDIENPHEGIGVQLIRLADGTLVDPLTRAPINKQVSPPSKGSQPDDETESDEDEMDENDVELVIQPTERRSIHDLSLNAAQMAVVNNVLVYTLWGLPLDEIAIQCNCTMAQVEAIRDMDEYKSMHEYLIEGLRTAYSSTIHGMIAEAAPQAARKLIRNIKSKSADISMTAVKDVLDRAGFRPADKVEHTHNIGNGSELVIRILKDSERDVIPTLDLDINA